MMQPLYNIKFWKPSHKLVLLLLTLLYYWPISFGIFSAKNDNITQFLPVRFHISEALRNGHLPLWTPYMYLGFPMHGDMQGGAWNPVVWVLSAFGRYNLTSLHLEILIYILLAALGMYDLIRRFKVTPGSCLIGAVAYLSCGYITDVGGSNLPFLAAAAYIPFVFSYYYRLLTLPSASSAFKLALFLALLFVSGYPSFFIMTFYVLLAALVAFLIKEKTRADKIDTRFLLLMHVLAVLIFMAASAPAVFSYVHILPHYQRGSGLNLQSSLQNAFNPSCIISLVFPSVPIKNPSSFSTDLISRNSYFNLILLVCFLSYLWLKKTFLQNFVVCGIIFFFLFSLGEHTPIRAFCYKFLPLMNTFRHPSNARLFLIIGGIIIGVISYDQFFSSRADIKYLIYSTIIVAVPVALSFILNFSNVSVVPKISILMQPDEELRVRLKEFLHALDYHDHLFINAIIQLLFLTGFVLLIKKTSNKRVAALLVLVNSFLLAQLTIPYTLVTKMDPKEINPVLNNIPAGFPTLDQSKTIGDNFKYSMEGSTTIVMENLYNKKIALETMVVSPTCLSLITKIIDDSVLKNKVLSKPYAFFGSNEAGSFFKLNKLWNNGFHFSTSNTDTALFQLQQVYLPGWHGYIEDKEVDVLKADNAFMAIRIPPGIHQVRFIYRPLGIFATFFLALVTLAVFVFLELKKL